MWMILKNTVIIIMYPKETKKIFNHLQYAS
jgi:hypothetical protein